MSAARGARCSAAFGGSALRGQRRCWRERTHRGQQRQLLQHRVLGGFLLAVAPRVDGDDLASVAARARLCGAHAFVFYGLTRRRCVAAMLCAAIACKSARRGGSPTRRVRPSRHSDLLPPVRTPCAALRRGRAGSVARSAARGRARIRRRRRSRQLQVDRPVLSDTHHRHGLAPERLRSAAQLRQPRRAALQCGAQRLQPRRSGFATSAALSGGNARAPGPRRRRVLALTPPRASPAPGGLAAARSRCASIHSR